MAQRDRFSTATNVLLILLASLALLWVARDLLIPVVLSIMLWSVVNALADRFQRVLICRSGWPASAAAPLHAGMVCEPWQRSRLERLCRYITRPPIATKRLSVDCQR